MDEHQGALGMQVKIFGRRNTDRLQALQLEQILMRRAFSSSFCQISK